MALRGVEQFYTRHYNEGTLYYVLPRHLQKQHWSENFGAFWRFGLSDKALLQKAIDEAHRRRRYAIIRRKLGFDKYVERYGLRQPWMLITHPTTGYLSRG